ncbi:hypothetical protein Bca52824_067753 [Brassica carinata]|uniref:Uncharacterized protein n=1 Tax=Brassica carinata TaxID=52824 RepID=A0A8X7QT30_BRACI|nr:hypothetical protein Bca52824_067753 [Brassica carinata]
MVIQSLPQVFGVSSSDCADEVKASGFTACDDQGLFKIIREGKIKISVCATTMCAGTDGSCDKNSWELCEVLYVIEADTSWGSQ